MLCLSRFQYVFLTLFTFFQVAEIYWNIIHHALPRTILLEGLWRLKRLPSVGSLMLQPRVMQPLKPVGCFVFEIRNRGRWIMWKDVELRMNKGKYIQHKLSEQIFENIWKRIDIETKACNHMYNIHLNIKLDQYDLWHYLKRSVDLYKMLSLLARPIRLGFSGPSVPPRLESVRSSRRLCVGMPRSNDFGWPLSL